MVIIYSGLKQSNTQWWVVSMDKIGGICSNSDKMTYKNASIHIT